MAFTEPGEPADFTGLRALFINCTLKRSPEPSNTQGLIDISTGIMDKHGVKVEVVRAVDHDIATGVWPDMREHGWDTDDWPAIFERVLASDILVLAGPIWLGDNSSVMKKVRVSFPCRRRLFADEWETITVCAVCMPCDSHVISLTISKRQRSRR